MKYDPKTKQMQWSKEDRQRQIREQFAAKPSLDELLASGEISQKAYNRVLNAASARPRW